ncbi:hypothetical protein Tcur_3451 [Thermomonospora curvata DSM 43183]|uniref:Uncharacterized protein n=1 Tax=Thermomonospora curvata (strain ATCC 19995 / DSM 43183 / JCM 3096 / KCTC 9072 / NBRC 15933 / NCIMB 10081 / Henssen B9) TaxID=471852 RepID=D1AB46_THECD|nr:hypothetical protein Tcur_3451 [Thermomonospora curvata DSM 43183]
MHLICTEAIDYRWPFHEQIPLSRLRRRPAHDRRTPGAHLT